MIHAALYEHFLKPLKHFFNVKTTSTSSFGVKMGRLTTIGVLVILGSVLSVAVLRYFDPLHRSRVPILLDPRRTRKHPLKVKLVEKKPLNSDCYIFTFELPKSSDGNDQQQRPVALGCDPGNSKCL